MLLILILFSSFEFFDTLIITLYYVNNFDFV